MVVRIVFALLLILTIGGILLYTILRRTGHRETPEGKAGRIGETLVRELILDILNDDDCLLTNVKLKTDGQETTTAWYPLQVVRRLRGGGHPARVIYH